MGVHKHESGGFRAYKKINGVEHQFYSYDESECDTKQLEYDALAVKTAKRKGPSLFNKSGRLSGFTIAAQIRKNRTPWIDAKKQITKEGEIQRDQITVKNINDAVAWLVKEWVEFHQLTADQLIKLSGEIKVAKALYLADISKANLKIEKALANE